MRQLVSTALAACIVGSVAGATVSTVAQAPVEPPVSTTAVNADTVDGLSAVKATSQKPKRANKLVAADAKGFLPSNIVKAKWGLIADKPAFLADGQVGWNEVAGVPAALADGQVGWGELQGIPSGLADGVDDAGVTGIRISYWNGPQVSVAANGGWNRSTAPCPTGYKAIGGGYYANTGADLAIDWLWTLTGGDWAVSGTNHHLTQAATLRATVVCLAVEPAGSMSIASKKGLAPSKLQRQAKRRQ
jgi:hypothetical protein